MNTIDVASIIALCTFLGTIIVTIFKVMNLTSFDEIFISKYKLKIYGVIKFIIVSFAIYLSILFFSFYLNNFLLAYIWLAYYIKMSKGIIDWISILSAVLMAIIYIYNKLDRGINKIVMKVSGYLPAKLKIRSIKDNSRYTKVKDNLFFIGIIGIVVSVYISFVITFENLFYNSSSKSASEMLILILTSFLLLLFILAVFLFYVKSYKRQSSGYRANYILGSTYKRKDINYALYALDTRGENKYILGDKETLDECDKVFIFNKEVDELMEFIRNTK